MATSSNYHAAAVLAVPIGAALGALVRASGVYAPQVIRAQMILSQHIVLKMFLGGVCGSSLALVVLTLLDKPAMDAVRGTKCGGGGGEGSGGVGEHGLVTAVLGGLIQGAGMTLTGCCPGMVYAQLGAGSESAKLVLVGGVLGALAYGLIQPRLARYQRADFVKTMESRLASVKFDCCGVGGFIPSALALASVAAAAAWGLEQLVPSPEIPEYDLINPVVAGALAGLLQIPLFFTLRAFLGMSAGYSVLSAQPLALCCAALPEAPHPSISYLRRYMYDCKEVWQIAFGLGIALGSHWLNDAGVPRPREVDSPVQSLLGGFLLLFGARMVNGCVWGHGLTGLPSFNLVSWFVVPSMFAGAFITGNVMLQALGKPAYLLET